MRIANQLRFSITEKIFLGGFALSSLGTGLVLPFLTLFLTSGVGLPAAQVGLALAVIAGMNIVLNVYAMWRPSRNPARVLALALLVQASGWFLLGSAASLYSALAAAAVVGIGEGLFFSSQLAAVSTIFAEARLPRFFAVQYRIANLCIALALGSIFVFGQSFGDSVLRPLVVTNGLSFLVFGVAVLIVIHRDETTSRLDEPIEPIAVFRVVSDRRYLRIVLIQLVWVGLTLAPAETVLPLLMTNRGLELSTVALLFVLNPVVVVGLGGLGQRYISERGTVRALGHGLVLAANSLLLSTSSLSYRLAIGGPTLCSVPYRVRGCGNASRPDDPRSCPASVPTCCVATIWRLVVPVV